MKLYICIVICNSYDQNVLKTSTHTELFCCSPATASRESTCASPIPVTSIYRDGDKRALCQGCCCCYLLSCYKAWSSQRWIAITLTGNTGRCGHIICVTAGVRQINKGKSPGIWLPIIFLWWAWKCCALFTVNRPNWIVMQWLHLLRPKGTWVFARNKWAVLSRFLPNPLPPSFWQQGYESCPRNGH